MDHDGRVTGCRGEVVVPADRSDTCARGAEALLERRTHLTGRADDHDGVVGAGRSHLTHRLVDGRVLGRSRHVLKPGGAQDLPHPEIEPVIVRRVRRLEGVWAMADAVATGTSYVDREFPLLIGGSWEAGADGTYDVVNPATEQLVGMAPEASVAQADEAARAAAEAFPAWSQTAPEERARLLSAAADRVRERAAELLPLVVAETGCTETVGRTMQIPVTAGRFDRYARGALEPSVIPVPCLL